MYHMPNDFTPSSFAMATLSRSDFGLSYHTSRQPASSAVSTKYGVCDASSQCDVHDAFDSSSWIRQNGSWSLSCRSFFVRLRRQPAVRGWGAWGSH